MSSSNRVQVSYLRESAWGTTPSSAFQAIPIVSGSMAHGQETVRSQTIRDDAQLSDSQRVGLAPTAQFDVEFHASIFDEFLRAAIRSDADWSTNIGISAASDIEFTNSGSTMTSTTTHLDVIRKGQWFRVSGTTNNNGWRKATAVSSYSVTLSGGAVTNESPASCTIDGQYILNGSTLHSYSLQEYFADLTNRYRVLTGARINSFRLEMTEGGIITASFAFDGKERAQAATAAGNGSITAVPDYDPATEVQAFDTLFIDEAAITYDVFRLSLDVAVGNRPRKALGNLARTAMTQGAPVVTAGFQMYQNDDSWAYDGDYEDFTQFSLAFSLNMQSGDYYVVELPQCQFTDEPGELPGLDNDVMLDFSVDAEPGGSYGANSDEKTIQICRVLSS